MQKKLIALAVAGLASGVAVAQTSVTMYGVLDLAYVYSSGNAGYTGAGVKIPGTNTFSGLSGIGAGNRLGFKGEEALGNGLKAVFTLEYGLDPDLNCGVGTCGLNARQQFVGLASNYGTVALGRQYSPGFNASANNDALDASDFGIQSSLSALNGMTITPNSPARFNNAITYTSPDLSGLKVSAIYSFGESTIGGLNNASTVDNSKVGVGLNYANGPINLDAVYQSRLSVTLANPNNPPPYTLPGTGSSVNEWYVGGSWDFKVVKVFASYQALDNNNNVLVTGIDSSDLWTAGISAPIGRGTLGLSYGRLATDRNYMSDGVSWGAGTQYTYPLSKRTSVYGAYSYFNNNKNVFPVSAGQAIAVQGVVGAPGESNYALGAGITHSF